MALQVWLPLNGDLRNLGLTHVTLSNNGATYTNTGGKLSKGCWNFSDGTLNGHSISINNNFTDIGANRSICAWVYPKGNHVNYTGAIISSGDWNANTRWAFGIKQDNSGFTGFDNEYRNYYSTSIPINTWTFLCVTVNNGITKFYKNGVYLGQLSRGSGSLTSNNSNTTIGKESYSSGYFGFNGSIQDIRIYDHTLSEDEIHELSLGKVGHWKLNDAEIESTTNILNSVTATCYNAANSKYGYSTTSNVLKTDGEFLNKQCTKIYPATNGSSWRPYTYLPTFVSNGGTDPKYKTLQFDYYSTTSTFLNPYKLGNGNSTAHWKCVNSTGIHTGSGTNNVYITVNPNEWNHVEIIFEGTSSESAQWGYIINGNAVTSSSNTYHLYANVMVEEKDHSTPYTKTSRVKDNVPDISGNHHDLTVNGNPTLSDDSVRYDKSCLFGSGISLTPLVPSFLTNEATVSMWVKLDQLPPSSPGRTMLYTTWYGFSCEVTSAGKTYFRTQLTSGTVDSPQGTITAGNWTHWVGVKSSTGVSLYLNGTLVGTTSNSNNFNWSSLASNAIGAYGGSYYTYGKLSDVRLYATALSEDDVLKLYKLGNI